MSRLEIPDISGFSHKREDRIRIRDIDFQRHVNNTVFAEFFASARHDFLTECVRGHLSEDSKMVVVDTRINFVNEMLYGAPVETFTRIKSVGRTSIQLEQVTCQNGRVASVAMTTMVHRGPEGGRPWPEAVVALAAN